MDKLIIQGGKKLFGEIIISGSKNAVLPILCASLLTSDTIYLENVPNIKDVHTTLDLLKKIGVCIEYSYNKVNLNASKINNLIAPYDLVKKMRASILVLGPLVSRFGKAKVSLPGGCAIGSRPVDQHIKGLKSMGAKIVMNHGFINAFAKKLTGTNIIFDNITVTGTENLLMAAVLADGETLIENAACEPEVGDLALLLTKMGAKIKGIGTNKLIINGVKKLNGAHHKIICDRIEAGTFLCAVATTGGEITLKNISPKILYVVLNKLRKIGLIIKEEKNLIHAKMNNRPIAVNIRTSEYPAFPTDMQSQFMILNAISKGTSKIIETIFENRFMHVQELNRLGTNIIVNGNTAIIHGVKKISGTKLIASDLRAAASFVIAGLVAQGETLIDRIYHLDRGYEQIEKKLIKIGADIKRIKNYK